MNHAQKNTMQIATITGHRQCLAFLAKNNIDAPTIPFGCNTVLKSFIIADGRHAVAVNQTGFTPIASDNEEQINGLVIFIADEKPTPSIERRLRDWIVAELQPAS